MSIAYNKVNNLCHEKSILTQKQSFLTSDGICSAHCRAKQIVSVCSRFESSKTIEALAEIAASPKVWIENDEGCDLVEITTPEIEYNIFGEPSHIHFDICLWQREVALW